MSDTKNRLCWLEDGRIITRNADGGTTAWTEKDAAELLLSLGEILGGLNGYRSITRADLVERLKGRKRLPPELRDDIGAPWLSERP